jgi:hypothetical protein
VIKDVRAMKEYKYCSRCQEEIYEGNITIDDSMISLPQEEAKAHTIKTDNEETARQAQEEKDQFLFNLREEINNLKWHAHTVEDAQLMEHLSFIFTQIADYIENH